MGHTSEGESCLVDVDGREDGGFACPYCTEVFETESRRDEHVSKRFQDTDNISRPRSDRTRHGNENIVEDWRENKGET